MAGAIPEAALPLMVEEHNETDTYATKGDLEGIVERVFEKLAPRIEETIKRAVESASQDTDKKLAAVEGKIRGEFTAQISMHMEQEAKKRQEDVEAVKNQLNEFTNETRKSLAEFKEIVGSASKTVSETMQAVQLLAKEVSGWSNVMGASRELYAENRRDIERLENESSLLVKEQATFAEKVTAIHRTIHGGEGEDSPSIFSELKRAWEYNQSQSRQIEAALQVARDTASRLDKFEQERQQEKELLAKAEQEKKERWSKRIGAAKSLAKEAAKTPYFWVILALSILGFVSIFRPEVLPMLIDFVKPFLDANP